MDPSLSSGDDEFSLSDDDGAPAPLRSSAPPPERRPPKTSIMQQQFRVHISNASFESNKPSEDRFDIHEDTDHVFAGIYDGHGGSKTSQFLKENFYSIMRSEISNNGGDVQAALTTAVPLADKRYTAKSKDNRDWSALFTGSCLISAYVDKRQMTLVCGNCGDSRAVLGVEEEGGFLSSRKLSYDHSADEDPELHRLRSEFPDDEAVIRETWDSYVLEYSHRVKDFARFTRSIGDLQLKDPECAKKFNSLQNQCQITPFPTHDRPYVSNEPHVLFHQLHRKDKFVIVASDGLWDEVSSDQAVFATGNFIERHGKEADIASYLLEYCLSKIAKRLAIENPELGCDTVEALRSVPPGKGGRRGLMDDQTIIVIVFDEENIKFDRPPLAPVTVPKRRDRLSTKDWFEVIDALDAHDKLIDADGDGIVAEPEPT